MTNMVDRITSRDTLDFTTGAPDYPASAGWSLVYKLIPRTAGTVYTLTSSASGDDHRIQATAATTAAWTAGTYSWTCYATKAAERYTLETGVTQILPDPGAVSTLDTRTTAQTDLDNVTAMLSGRASSAVQEYEIAGRRLKNYPIGELLKLQSFFKQQVLAEQASARIAAGLAPANKLQVRI